MCKETTSNYKTFYHELGLIFIISFIYQLVDYAMIFGSKSFGILYSQYYLHKHLVVVEVVALRTNIILSMGVCA